MTSPALRSNQDIAEGMIRDLNELIDARGNAQLIPALICVVAFRDEIVKLKREIAEIQAALPEDDYDYIEPIE